MNLLGLFRFRMRRQDRIEETDRWRFARLVGSLDEIVAQIDREKAGLDQLVPRLSADAAFASEAMEAGEPISTKRLNDISQALARALTRSAILREQSRSVGLLRHIAASMDDRVAIGSETPHPEKTEISIRRKAKSGIVANEDGDFGHSGTTYRSATARFILPR